MCVPCSSTRDSEARNASIASSVSPAHASRPASFEALANKPFNGVLKSIRHGHGLAARYYTARPCWAGARDKLRGSAGRDLPWLRYARASVYRRLKRVGCRRTPSLATCIHRQPRRTSAAAQSLRSDHHVTEAHAITRSARGAGGSAGLPWQRRRHCQYLRGCSPTAAMRKRATA